MDWQDRFLVATAACVLALFVAAIIGTSWEYQAHVARCEKWYADSPSEAERCVYRRGPIKGE